MKRLLSLFGCLLVVLSLAACQKEEAPPARTFNNIDVTGLDYAKDFSLKDHNGQVRTLADFKGKLVLVFFGFTQCPDVCPTTLMQMAEVMQALGPDADKKLQVLFVSVDPDRDTPEILAQYVPSFHPSFLGLVGNQEETDKLVKDFKLFVRKVPNKKSPEHYGVDHTAGSYVYDTTGHLRLFVSHNNGTEPLLQDLKQLLQ